MNLAKAKAQLLASQAELEARLERTHKHIHRTEAVSPKFSEQAVETGNDDVVQALERDAQQDLIQIRKALLRLEKGDYPFCTKCGQAIGEERLRALPWTEFCITCA